MEKISHSLCFVFFVVAAFAGTTVDPNNQYAYGANIGWINAQGDVTNGAVIGQAFCSGYMYGANVGWISLGDGTPDDGMKYGNDSATDYGINHDGVGNLTGYAYGANIGWINFEQTYGKPKVDRSTGELSGYVWGANVGWIGLSGVATLTIDSGPDTDGDGIPDAWEYGHTNVLTALGGGDFDGDGVSDVNEYLADTDPFDPNDRLVITELTVAADTNLVAWTCVPTRKYTLEYKTDLTSSNWTAAGSSFIPSSGPEMDEEVIGANDSNRFYRVKAAPPLSQ